MRDLIQPSITDLSDGIPAHDEVRLNRSPTW